MGLMFLVNSLVNNVAVNSTSVLVAQLLLLRSGDVETNPGPVNGQKRSRSTNDDAEEDGLKSKISKEDGTGTNSSLEHAGRKRSRSTNDDGEEDGIKLKISKQAPTEGNTDTRSSSSAEQFDSTLRVLIPTATCIVPISQSAEQQQVAETPFYKDEDRMEIIRDNQPEVKPANEMNCLKQFCRKVKVILHTVNDNEKWAVLEYMNPPVLQGQPAEKLIDYKINSITLGMFGGYSSAMIQTEMGANAGEELSKALSEFPNAKVVIAIGVAYARNPDKAKLGDVLVSTTIDGISNIKFSSEGKVMLREGPRRWTKVSQLLINVFTRGKETWYAVNDGFKVNSADDNASSRISKVHTGMIVSYPALIDYKEIRDKIMADLPEAIGGEMEGAVLLEIRNRFATTQPTAQEFGIILIKGVADYGDGNKKKEWQLTAAMAAANYASHKLSLTKGTLFGTEEDSDTNSMGSSAGGVGQASTSSGSGSGSSRRSDSSRGHSANSNNDLYNNAAEFGWNLGWELGKAYRTENSKDEATQASSKTSEVDKLD